MRKRQQNGASAGPQNEDHTSAQGPSSANGVAANGHSHGAVTNKTAVPGKKGAPIKPSALGDIAVLVLVYGSLLTLSTYFIRTGPRPLELDAPASRFSEARAMQHIQRLAGDIVYRQEGREGLRKTAAYLLEELEKMRELAGDDIRFELDVSQVTGSFNQRFVKKYLTHVYQNLTNIAVRISAADRDPSVASVLLNAHFDGPPQSPGAADCAACVATLLEGMRQILESRYIPPQPIIFLFNGGEEVFSKAVHGFVTSHSWSPNVGALINLEAAGAALPDFVVQSGPGSWPVRVYAERAVRPAGSGLAADIFPHVPGDTDFRIFSQDFDDVPGLDIVALLDAYSYHSMKDTPENLMPGLLQVRGDNFLPLLDGFLTAPELKTRAARKLEALKGEKVEGKPGTFFDFFGVVMVYYPYPVAVAIHFALFAAVLYLPKIISAEDSGCATSNDRYNNMVTGFLFYVVSCIVGLNVPVLHAFAVARLTGKYMSWYSHPWLIPVIYVPSTVLGLLLPHLVRFRFSTEADKAMVEWTSHWGTLLANAFLTAIITWAGGRGSYLFLLCTVGLLPALTAYRWAQKRFGEHSPLAVLAYVLPGLPAIAYCVHMGNFLVMFIAQRCSMVGTHPLPYGPYLPDAAAAGMVGISVVLAFGPIVPLLARRISPRPTLVFLLLAALLASAGTSFVFPYTTVTPKRVLVQRTTWTEGESKVLDSQLILGTLDANDITFVARHAPQLRAVLNISDQQPLLQTRRTHLSAVYPINEISDRPAAAPVPPAQRSSEYRFPMLREVGRETVPAQTGEMEERRRVLLELDTGSLQNVWVAVLNITGPLAGISTAGGQMPVPERSPGGPPSYMIHYAGPNHNRWRFWVEMLGTAQIRIDLFVTEQKLHPSTEELVRALPHWVEATPFEAFLSTYVV